MKKGSFRCKLDAEARALGFKRVDKRRIRWPTYLASFEKRDEIDGEWTLHKNATGDWQAHRVYNNWHTPWFKTPDAAWLYGCLHNWGAD